MAWHFVRVELHNAKDPDDYDNLHRYMANVGFTRTIRSDNGVFFDLPSGMYSIETTENQTSSAVLNLAETAIKRVGKNYSVIAIKSSSSNWSGLNIHQS